MFSRSVEAWLPTQNRVDQDTILRWMAEAAATGVDPVAVLRDCLSTWFGQRAQAALPVPPLPGPGSQTARLALEPLAVVRQPTMWPHRPKRLVDELFSSWLWRTALAAGAPPRVFAQEVLGTSYDDLDRDVPPATLHRLALLSGQRREHLERGTLVDAPTVAQDTMAGFAENLLLRDGRFLLGTRSRDHQGRPRPVLQYCSVCLAADERPHFLRAWRLVHVATCEKHYCLLLDRCWQCATLITPIEQRTTSMLPHCHCCDAPLTAAPVIRKLSSPRRQRNLRALLFYLAYRVPASRQRVHLDTLFSQLGQTEMTSTTAREKAITRMHPVSIRAWFGQAEHPDDVDALDRLAEGKSYAPYS